MTAESDRLVYLDADDVPPEHRAKEREAQIRDREACRAYNAQWRAVVAAQTPEAVGEALEGLETHADRFLLFCLALQGRFGEAHPLVDLARRALPSPPPAPAQLELVDLVDDDDDAERDYRAACRDGSKVLEHLGEARRAESHREACAWLDLATEDLDHVLDPQLLSTLATRIQAAAAVLAFKWSKPR